MSSTFLLFVGVAEAEGRRKMEINVPSQQIHANSKGGLINEGGVMSSEYGS